VAGLSVLLWLPEGARDGAIAREALAFGLAPSPLSAWFCPAGTQRSGLLLGVATTTEDQLPAACDRLHHLIRTFS
jgi:GntR family transcriptional regulator/MocR family aminotransferase